MKFPFRGNIRQLKNLAEQISLLEENREVDAITLAKYLPSEESSSLPAPYKPQGSGSGEGSSDFSEREILYKVLFDMKKDMTDLKKLVLETYQSGGLSQNIIKKHHSLFEDMESSVSFDENASKPSSSMPIVLESGPSSSGNNQESDEYEDEGIEDIIHEEDDNSLSIEKKEKELIIKALRKHNNKRKYAAQDLGISERTLYRKIKQYDINE